MGCYNYSMKKLPALSKTLLMALGLVVLVFTVMDFNFLWFNIKNNVKKTPILPTTITQPQGAPNQLNIPSLNITAPIIYVEKTNEADFQAALKNGVVHYPGTAVPGGNGNCYIFGHSSDYIWSKGNYKTIFAPLPKIKIGVDILITNQAGQLFTYRVTKTFVISANDLSVLAQDQSQKILTLQTSYPLGTALRRFIVVAEIK